MEKILTLFFYLVTFSFFVKVILIVTLPFLIVGGVGGSINRGWRPYFKFVFFLGEVCNSLGEPRHLRFGIDWVYVLYYFLHCYTKFTGILFGKMNFRHLRSNALNLLLF